MDQTESYAVVFGSKEKETANVNYIFLYKRNIGKVLSKWVKMSDNDKLGVINSSCEKHPSHVLC